MLAHPGNSTSYQAVTALAFKQLGMAIGTASRATATSSGRRLQQAGSFDLSDPTTVLSLLQAVQASVPSDQQVAVSQQVLQVRCRAGGWLALWCSWVPAGLGEQFACRPWASSRLTRPARCTPCKGKGVPLCTSEDTVSQGLQA
jgi:hypothetical protein